MAQARPVPTPIAYKGFTPLGRSFYVHDPIVTDPLEKRRVPIPLYKPILTDEKGFHPEKVFCFLGPNYDNTFMELDTMLARLFPDARQVDRDCYLNTHEHSFAVWCQDGTLCSKVPSGIFEDTDISDFETWDAKQSAKWKNIVSASAEQASKVPNDHGHFIEPATSVSLWFSPAPSNILSVEQLEHIFKEAFADESLGLHEHDANFCTFEEAKRDSLVLVGNNPFHLYYMWMRPQDFQDMWSKAGVTTLEHPWPKDKPAVDALDRKIDRGKACTRDCEEQIIQVTREKYLMAATFGEQPESEAFVMGGLSATDVGKDLWGTKQSKTDKADDLEWLSRVHFCLGGLTSGVNSTRDAEADPATYLAKSNIILGTDGCKSHMTRIENAIINSLESEASSNLFGLKPGQIWTLDNHIKGSEVRRITTKGERTLHKVPDWVGTQKYPWLSLELQYYTTMTYRSLGDITLCSFETFDPLSRYAPTLVEAKLDRWLAFHLKEHSTSSMLYHAPIPSSPYRSTKALPDLSPASPVSPHDAKIIKVWQNVKSGAETVTVGDITITNPKIVESLSSSFLGAPSESGRSLSPLPSPRLSPALLSPITPSAPFAADSLPPPQGFVVAGGIALFGMPNVRAHLHKWQGPAPAHVKLGDEPLSVESAHVEGVFRLSSVIKSLEGTAFDKITFRKARFYHQNYPFDQKRSVGWHFDAELVIDKHCGGLYEVLTKVLGVKETTVQVHSALGLAGGWKKHLEPHSFMLDGLFPVIPADIAQPTPGLQLTTIGVHLMAIRKLKFSPHPESVLRYGFGVFGTMNLEVPDSVVPLPLEYEMRESNGTVQIGASVSGGIWHKPFGVNGVLRNAHFSAAFPIKAPWKDFSFDISAMFPYKLTYATFAGTCTPHGDFVLSSYFPDFLMKNVADLFEHVSGDYIKVPTIDTRIGSATIYLRRDQGLSVTLHDFEIAGHRAKKADIEILSTRAIITGKLDREVIEFGDVQLHEPHLHIHMESQHSLRGRKTDTVIQGNVELDSHLTFPAAAYLYPASKGTDWTVMATLTDAKKPALALSKIVPELENTSLDLVIRDVVFVAASKDHPDIGQMITNDHKHFHHGVQFCAMIDDIPILDKVMRHKVLGLKLRAEWSRASGFNLKVLTPMPTILDLGHNLKTNDIQLAIETDPAQLSLSSELKVPVAHSSAPLVFKFNLLADDNCAKVKGEMNDWWANPLGAGENVKIGPKLTLSLNIEFKDFCKTLVPHISGGLQIGNTPVTVALTYEKDPMKQLLYGQAPDLSKADLVSFAKSVTKASVKDIPGEFSDFKSVKIYIRPAAGKIGDIPSPQGFSLTAAATFCGKQTDIAGCIDGRQIFIAGPVKAAELGPLKLKGIEKPDAVVHSEISNSKQVTELAGKTKIYDTDSTVLATINPDDIPKLKFHTTLPFSKMVQFQLKAEHSGAFPLKNLRDAEFTLHADFEPAVREHMREAIFSRFVAAGTAARDSAAHETLDMAERDLKHGLDNAKTSFEITDSIWKTKEKEVTQKQKTVETEYEKRTTELQIEVTTAQADYQTAVDTAERKVLSVVNTGKSLVAEAAAAFVQAKRNREAAVADTQLSFEHAQKQYDCRFASIHEDIARARQGLEYIDRELREVQRTIDDYNGAPWYEVWKKAAIPDLLLKLTAIQVTRAAAEGILRVAEAAFNQGDFINARNNYESAKKIFEETKKAKDSLVELRERELKRAEEKAKLDEENAKVELNRTQTNKDAAVKRAQAALKDYKAAKQPEINAAIAAVKDLPNTEEWHARADAAKRLYEEEKRHADLLANKEKYTQDFKVQREALVVSRFATQGGTFEIARVCCKGNLKEIVDKTGKFGKALTAEVVCDVRGEHCNLSLVFDPREVDKFIDSVYHGLWNHIRDDHCKEEIALEHTAVTH